MKREELELLKEVLEEVLEEANLSNTGNHWLPEKYSSQLLKAFNIVHRELNLCKLKTANTFSVFCGARNCYLSRDTERAERNCYLSRDTERTEYYWGDVDERKQHPSIAAAMKWIPKERRRDPEWEMAIHEFDGDTLIAKHTI